MIPSSPDVRRLIGDWAEAVDNRSLLYEKFSLPKLWPQRDKLNDAGRWSVLRLASGGSRLLLKDAERLEYQAGGRNIRPENAERCRLEARIARQLAVIAPPDPALAELAASRTRRFLENLLVSHPGRVATFEARLGGRLLVNQAGGVIENAGLCLDRCFGRPFLPGSAVKGIARAQAIQEIQQAPPADRPRLLTLAMLLFGFGGSDLETRSGREGDYVLAAGPQAVHEALAQMPTDDSADRSAFKGLVAFLPAHPTEPPTIVVDIVNPHHRDYYRFRGGRPATDDESPFPNYFPAVEAGSAFGFALLLTRVPAGCPFAAPELIETARGWLERAITIRGAGAKTAAGYGWFFAPGQEPPRPNRPASSTATPGTPAPAPIPADPLIAKWRGRLGTTGNFPAVLPDLSALAADADRLRRVFEAIFPDTELHSLRNGKRTPYWQSFSSRPQGAAILQKLGFAFRK